MTLQRRVNGRADVNNKIINILRKDEHLLRLLNYNYLDERGVPRDVLDSQLPDITSSKDYTKISTEHIIKASKIDEIKTVKTCMVLVHLGKRRPVFYNYMLAKQEVLIDVLVHNDYQEKDYRLDDICDRLDYLLIHEKITMGKFDISTPIPMEAPKEYGRYQIKYTYWTSKK